MWKQINQLSHGELFKLPMTCKTFTGKEIEKNTMVLMVRSETDIKKAKDEHGLPVPAHASCVVLPDGFPQFIEVFHDMQVNVMTPEPEEEPDSE